MMEYVGKAASELVMECMKHFPKDIDGGEQPDYEQCIFVSMKVSLNEMLASRALVFLSLLCPKLCLES